MAEGHAANRWRNDRAVRTVAILGQVFAFLTSALVIAAGVYLVSQGHSGSGIAAIFATIAAIVAAYMKREKS